MDQPMVQASQREPPTLANLPFELRSLILSHLAPSGDDRFKPAAKTDLENANLAHRSLHVCANTFLFRDRSLLVAIPGVIGQLHRLLLDPFGREVAKYVRAIQVKVSPVFEEGAVAGSYLTTLIRVKERTNAPLLPKPGTKDEGDFCRAYQKAMMVPFQRDNDWPKLFRRVLLACNLVFPQLPNLAHVDVGVCEREDSPAGTLAHAFVSRYGKALTRAERMEFRWEEYGLNLAITSCIVMKALANTTAVNSLRLYAYNYRMMDVLGMDTQCLGLLYQEPGWPLNKYLDRIRFLTLHILGRDCHYPPYSLTRIIGSLPMISYWRECLSRLRNLTTVEVCGGPQRYLSNRPQYLIDKLFAGVNLPVKSFLLRQFNVDTTTFLFLRSWLNLKYLRLESIMLTTYVKNRDDVVLFHCDNAWLKTGQCLAENMPQVSVSIHKPRTLDNMLGVGTGLELNTVHSDELDKLSLLPNIELDGDQLEDSDEEGDDVDEHYRKTWDPRPWWMN